MLTLAFKSDPVRFQDPAFYVNADPDPEFEDQNKIKKLQLKKYRTGYYFIDQKLQFTYLSRPP